MNKKQFIPAVNLHLTNACNMHCRYCFSHYEKDFPEYAISLQKNEQFKIINELFVSGFRKISFAGGEPTLCTHLSELIKYAKNIGFATMLVTNGSGINPAFLQSSYGYLDWICLSIDSISTDTNKRIGRHLTSGIITNKDFYTQIINTIKHFPFRLKINTVVSQYNLKEDFNDFLAWSKPERWKVFQVLPIEGQNITTFSNYQIYNKEMDEFLLKHSGLKTLFNVVPERNNDMKGSYVMINPSGRFYCNSNGNHAYSELILKVGVRIAIGQMPYDFNKFINRNGVYNW